MYFYFLSRNIWEYKLILKWYFVMILLLFSLILIWYEYCLSIYYSWTLVREPLIFLFQSSRIFYYNTHQNKFNTKEKSVIIFMFFYLHIFAICVTYIITFFIYIPISLLYIFFLYKAIFSKPGKTTSTIT